MWAAADEMDAGLDRIAECGAVRRTVRAGHRRVRERDELDVHEVGVRGDGLLRGPQVPDAGARPTVDVAANGSDAAEEQLVEGGADPRHHVVVGEHPCCRCRDPGLDRTTQIAGGVRDGLGRECLVEVGMGFGHRRQQQPTADIDRSIRRAGILAGRRRLDIRAVGHDVADEALRDTDVDMAAVGQPGVGEQLRHGGIVGVDPSPPADGAAPVRSGAWTTCCAAVVVACRSDCPTTS